MLWRSSEIIGCGIRATDGSIGSVADLLIEDTSWTVRWTVVDTGSWSLGRKVLLPPSVLGRPDAAAREFPVDLTRKQVEGSPDIDTDAPVSRQLESSTWLTPQVALLWPKRRILEVYLNVVEFGPGLYGAEAAARAFFGKAASALSPREAARLAAVLPNPLQWSAGTPGPNLLRRAAVIERRIAQIRPLLGCAR